MAFGLREEIFGAYKAIEKFNFMGNRFSKKLEQYRQIKLFTYKCTLKF